MATWHITHRCGHIESHVIYKSGSQADKQAMFLEGQPCSACQREQWTAQRAVESASAAVENAEDGLVPLWGSSRQITWAETIRNEQMTRAAIRLRTWRQELFHQSLSDDVDALADRYELTLAETRAVLESCYAAALARFRALKHETRAGWWIDHRMDPPEKLLEMPTLAELFERVLGQREAT